MAIIAWEWRYDLWSNDATIRALSRSSELEVVASRRAALFATADRLQPKYRISRYSRLVSVELGENVRGRLCSCTK